MSGIGLMEFFMFYLFIINVYGLLLMGVDKRRARKNSWRIPESTLWITAVLGGAIGALAGMYAFRHKTKHLAFKVGFPILAIVETILFVRAINLLS